MRLQIKAPPAIIIWPAVLIFLVGFGLWQLIPKPPSTITMTTGGERGLYYRFGVQLAQELAKERITLQVLPSAGSAENLKRLEDRSQNIDLALLQGGVGSPEQQPNIFALASVFDEQIWIFYRRQAFKKPPTQISQLRDKRISISMPGSGTRVLGLELLRLGGLNADGETSDVKLMDLDARDSLKSLASKTLDAALLVAGPQTPIIAEYLSSPELSLMSLVHADALALRMPYLKSTLLPRGAINLAQDLPRSDTKLLAATATLVIHEDIHPALITPILKASEDALKKMGLLQAEGDFPSAIGFSWPHDEDAKEYLKKGPSFLYRHLPFWGAVWADRAIRLVLPLLIIIVPLIRYLPALLKAGIEARLSNIYRQLRTLEKRCEADRSLAWEAELSEIEHRARELRVPKKYAVDVYTLRMHIDMARDHLSSSSR